MIPAWKFLTSEEAVDRLKERSHDMPCLIFKHSTRCSISAIARMRLEEDWSFEGSEVEPYYLDLLSYRPVSKYIAETFDVYHESPQILLIVNGECVYDTSHLDIRVDDVKEVLEGVRRA
jgi:bacillithiol system protein YtxJ